ncbi:MAG TPA: nucleotide-binding protein [Candidatus Angelobacter sp.]|jgi:predicted nucleotide-binding protein|nr:nucleotide-binding protein [Candidatus Angelobacter sp.]
MLIQLAKDLIQPRLDFGRFLPRILDMQAIVPRSAADFFRAVYSLVVQDISDGSVEIHNYQDFLASLDKAKTLIERVHGPKWLVILLIDELDSAIATLPDSECLQNLRNLLMNSRFSFHFRVVATGVSSLAEMVNDQSSPLNNLDPVYLQILPQTQVHQLILKGFPNGLPTTTEELLLEQSGRHPYILQGLLERLYEDGEILEPALRTAARRFVRERAGTFRRWLVDFRNSGCAVYQALAGSPMGCLNRRKLRAALSSTISIDDATTILSYHGVIDDADSESPRVSGTMFRDWFSENHSLDHGAGTGVLDVRKADIKSKPGNQRVFVVYGRNERLRVALFTLLRALQLEPLEWTAVVEATGSPNPYMNEILKTGFRIAQAAIVLFTPDDEARLKKEFQKSDDPPYESDLYPQPRLNVVYEAGMAMALFPNQTIFVQVGDSRPFSDIAGIHYLRMDNSIAKRRDFASRLKRAGCSTIDLELSTEWQTAGNFALPESEQDTRQRLG